MPRNITVTLSDGSQHVYANAPDDLTPEQVTARAKNDFGMDVAALDGGRNAASQPAQEPAQDPVALGKQFHDLVMDKNVSRSAIEAMAANHPEIGNVKAVLDYRDAKGPYDVHTYTAKPDEQPTPVAAPSPPTRDEQLAAVGKKLSDQDTTPDEIKGLLGGLRAFPGANYLSAGLAKLTGNDGGQNFDDVLKVIQARTAADQEKSILGNLTGQGLGLFAGGGLVKGIGALASRGVPLAGEAANILQSFAPAKAEGLALGTRALNLAKVAGAGAIGGAASALNQGDDVGTGAAIGAVAAPALGGAAKALDKLLVKPVSAALGTRGASAILQKYVGATAQEIQDAAQAFKQRAGTDAEPTVYEVLNSLKDREGVAKFLSKSPASARDQAASLVRERAAAIGPELQSQIRKVTQPARDRIVSQISDDLARARGGNVLPGDQAIVNDAATTATSVPALRSAEADAITEPYRNTRIADSLSDLYPSTPGPNGESFVTDPEVAEAIRSVAGPLRIRPDGAGVSADDVNGMLTKLRERLGKGTAESDIAEQAINHLHDTLDQVSPEAGQAARQVRDVYAARSRMGEGIDEGMRTRLREDIPGATNNSLAQKLDNAYNTQEGVAGRTLGQSNALLSAANGSPDEALSLAQDIADNPRTQRAITNNLGGRGRQGEQIADAAQAQAESARRLSGLDKEQRASEGGGSLVSLAHALIGLHPGSFIATKAHALSGLSSFFDKIPERQANTITEALFSRDPAKVSNALKFFAQSGDAGKQALSKLSGALSSGAVAGQLDKSAQTAPQEEAPKLQTRESKTEETKPQDEVPFGHKVISDLFPNAKVTSDVRSKDDPLSKANPSSYHVNSQNAVDVRPIPGLSFNDFVDKIREAGHTILEARDEVNHPSEYATGKHWHVVIG